MAPVLLFEPDEEDEEEEDVEIAQYAWGQDEQSMGTETWQLSPLAQLGHAGDPSWHSTHALEKRE